MKQREREKIMREREEESNTLYDVSEKKEKLTGFHFICT